MYNPDGGFGFGEFDGDSPEEAVAEMLRNRGYEVDLDVDAGEVVVDDPVAAGYYETIQDKNSNLRTVQVRYGGF